MIDYTKPDIWDVIWSRPYVNYEKHHQLFWGITRQLAKGKILDIACGSASMWKNTTHDVTGCDFSQSAIIEARKNCPKGKFTCCAVPTDIYAGQSFDTVCVIGLVNYYRNLEGLKKMISRATYKGSKILITVNVLQDFPDRYWDENQIYREFAGYGAVEATFHIGVGWYIVINSS